MPTDNIPQQLTTGAAVVFIAWIFKQIFPSKTEDDNKKKKKKKKQTDPFAHKF